MDVSLEAILGVGIAGTGLVLGVMHRWKADICKDIQGMKAENKVSQEELKEYLQLRTKITDEINQRLARIEGRQIERDTETRD